jgi:Phage capsid family
MRPPRPRPATHLVRAVVANALNNLNGELTPERHAKLLWPNDPVTPLITRSAVVPADTVTSGWASQLAQTVIPDFISTLAPVSTSAALLQRGLQFSFDNANGILVPGVIADASEAGFVGQGSAIPVEQLALSGPTLSPRKVAAMSVFTREVFLHSVPNIEAFVGDVLRQSVGHTLDTIMLDTTAGDTVRPAGLRNGISGQTASALTIDTEAMYDDLDVLIGLVSAAAGSSPIVIVAAPRQAAAIKMRQPNFPFEVFASSGLAAGTVIALATNCLVSAVDPSPRIQIGNESAVHMEDASPTALTTNVSTWAVPIRSLWQTDCLSIRLILEISWALRNASGLAWTSSVVW